MTQEHPEDLRKRTKRFAIDIIHFVEGLPRGRSCDALARQLIRSGTSVGANCRAAKRAKSNADFISKMGTVEEEADETVFWLELLTESGLVSSDATKSLMNEGNELVAIAVASIKTARLSGK